MKIVMGLGNPGLKYSQNRHNVGFWVVNFWAEKLNLKYNEYICQGEIAIKNFSNMKVILVKPMTFMNRSGISFKCLCEIFGVDLKECLIVYDDLDLPLGQMRMREKGSSGGHRGMESIIEEVKTNNIPRLRIGIGRPPDNQLVHDYVLEDFSTEEIAGLEKLKPRLWEGFNLFCRRSTMEAIKIVNRRDNCN